MESRSIRTPTIPLAGGAGGSGTASPHGDTAVRYGDAAIGGRGRECLDAHRSGRLCSQRRAGHMARTRTRLVRIAVAVVFVGLGLVAYDGLTQVASAARPPVVNTDFAAYPPAD